MQNNAVLYCRSSKDRHDVSIDAQRRDLQALAATHKLTIVGEFVDVVESGADEDRPGFQALYTAMRDRNRTWSTILVIDTSRIARRIATAYWFEEREAARRGVKVIYKTLPDMDAAELALIKAVFRGVDEFHSLASKRKGLSGMAENVHQGFRAGGRAPLGYKLSYKPTGATRDGQAVTKSKLIKDSNAPAVGKYLKLRAAGAGRRAALRESGITAPETTLIGMEWNALTYAGATVWNVHNERIRGAYVAGTKRRPRKDWIIKHDTHPALITLDEAEALLRQLEARRARTTQEKPSAYVLTGLLKTPAGDAWHGCADRQKLFYRTSDGVRRRVSAEKIEKAILAKMANDFRSEKFAAGLTRAAQRLASPDPEIDALARAHDAIGELDRKIARVTAMLGETAATRPLFEQIEKWELERERIRATIVDAETRLRQARAVASITDRDIRRILDRLGDDIESLDRDRLKDYMRGVVTRIDLDPATLHCKLHYAIPAYCGDVMASPRRHADTPSLRVQASIRLVA